MVEGGVIGEMLPPAGAARPVALARPPDGFGAAMTQAAPSSSPKAPSGRPVRYRGVQPPAMRARTRRAPWSRHRRRQWYGDRRCG
jgi:hypothetical protein